jgi:hypothetical protein
LAVHVLAVPAVPNPVERSTTCWEELDLAALSLNVLPDSVVVTSAKIP